jgi:AAA domain/DnaB-like helicase N terminal domain
MPKSTPNAKKPTPATPPNEDLPPHSVEIERAALGCVILAGETKSLAEVDALLVQLIPQHFYTVECKEIHRAMVTLRMEGHAIDSILVGQWLKANKSAIDPRTIPDLADKVPSMWNFPTYLADLRELSEKRWALRKSVALAEAVASGDVAAVRAVLADTFEQQQRSVAGREKLIDVITPAQARQFEPNPADFLVGDGLVIRGQVITVGGAPGVGKSRLATSLAVAGASGLGFWQGYPVRSRWRTLILQTENNGLRLKEECEAINPKFDEFIKISNNLPQGINFGSAEFRRELVALYDAWPFEMLVLDPLNDIVAEDGQADYKEAMANIRRAFSGRAMPAIVFVAHLRKPRAEHGNRRKSGRELLHELSGTLAIGSTSRTVFIVQAATNDMADDRIIFEVAKANDCKPDWLSEFGTRTAWHRRNGTFSPCEGFDWSAWDNPGNEERRAVSDEMLEAALEDEPDGLKAWRIAEKIAEANGIGKSTVARAIAEGGYLRHRLQPVAKGGFKLKG